MEKKEKKAELQAGMEDTRGALWWGGGVGEKGRKPNITTEHAWVLARVPQEETGPVFNRRSRWMRWTRPACSR